MTNTPKQDEVREALERIQSLRDESLGVHGFHLNGDLEDWDYFEIDEDLETIRQALTPKEVDVERCLKPQTIN